MTLAEEMGLKVERRHIYVEELGEFEELGACGTAAVITPIRKIVDRDSGHTWEYCADGNAGPKSTQLYNRLRAIQLGEVPDVFNWNTIIE
jgi:branched-chain amino acid aminotransferase